MLNGTDKIIQYYNEIQGVAAVILGLLLQYFLGDGRGAKIALIITLSTLFVALFIAPAIIEALNINPASKLSNAIYALSALMSVEMLLTPVHRVPFSHQPEIFHFLSRTDNTSPTLPFAMPSGLSCIPCA